MGWAHTGGVEVERGGLGGGCGGGMLSERERMLGVSMAGVRCSKVCLEGEGVVRRARGWVGCVGQWVSGDGQVWVGERAGLEG